MTKKKKNKKGQDQKKAKNKYAEFSRVEENMKKRKAL